MSRRGLFLALTLLVLAALAIMAAALAVDDNTQVADSGIQEIEISDYKGEKLGSVDDFRENSITGVQMIDPLGYTLRISGLVSQTASFALAELASYERAQKLVTLNCVEGWSVKALWEGIPLRALLETVTPLESANTVIFHAEDGYTTSLPLEFILERDLIIADRINGLTLPPASGFPFQLVAETKWGYKWIRWLTRIELSNDADYEGFWERRGFNNDASTDGPRFEP